MRPRSPHEPAELSLLVSRTPEGALRLTTPMTPGWAAVARTPGELALAVEWAYVECAVAAYARLRGMLYDLAETETEIPPEAYARAGRHPDEPAEPEPAPADEVTVRRRKKHPRTHEPEEWVETSDGSMISPTGRTYGPHTRIVASVRARRR